MKPEPIRTQISILFNDKDHKGLKNQFLSILKKVLKKVEYKSYRSRETTSFLVFNFFWITKRFGEKFKYIFKNWFELEFLVILEYYLDKKAKKI